MNFFKEHYEKVAMGIGGLVLVAGVYFGINGISSAEKFVMENGGGSPGSLPKGLLGEPSDRALKQLNGSNELASVYDPNKPSRQFYIFKSIPRYGRSGQKVPIDIEDPKAVKIHPPIDNSYWLNNGIADLLVYENALDLDPDKDGFSIREEYEAKTDPNDAKKFPDLLDKVGVEKVMAEEIGFKFTGSGAGRVFPGFSCPSRKLRISELQPLSKGDKFPRVEPRNRKLGIYKERYEFVSLEGSGQDRTLTLKDVITGELIPVPREGKKAEDIAAVFYLDALGKGGEEGVVLRSGQQFSLPFGGAPLSYKVESIKKKEGTEKTYIIIISGPNGKTREIEVSSS